MKEQEMRIVMFVFIAKTGLQVQFRKGFQSTKREISAGLMGTVLLFFFFLEVRVSNSLFSKHLLEICKQKRPETETRTSQLHYFDSGLLCG